MKKILFNDKYSLTKKVLKGEKTMTRRLMKEPKGKANNGQWIMGPYNICDVIAVAQSYKDAGYSKGYDKDMPDRIQISKRPDIFVPPSGWTNKMFVWADLMPWRIKITGVKIEQL